MLAHFLRKRPPFGLLEAHFAWIVSCIFVPCLESNLSQTRRDVGSYRGWHARLWAFDNEWLDIGFLGFVYVDNSGARNIVASF